MFSVGDIYDRLRAFSTRFQPGKQQLYFAKVDVQSAFDTIPQSAVIKVLRTIPKQARYTIMKHVEVKLVDNDIGAGNDSGGKLSRRWHALAKADHDAATFLEKVEAELARRKKNTVFVDNAMAKHHETGELLQLAASHVQQNLVKVGKKYYRQKNGIPQGSVLSSTLCNYFYAELEKRHLHFLASEDCLLLRLIDDFLLITTDRAKAASFVKVMHVGVPEYGVAVNPGKTLINFDMRFAGTVVPKLPHGQTFPYCGTRIDCRTLNIAKDRGSAKDPGTQATSDNLMKTIVRD
jgi:telomerase reverse transcriptase